MVFLPSLQQRLHMHECSSTNTMADQLIIDQSFLIREHGLYITADYQSAGRGHGKNSWYSSRGSNLLMSLIINNPTVAPEWQFNLSRWAALALFQCLGSVLPVSSEIRIKWPNDIVCNQKKIAGMLIENKIAGSKILQSIIGIGLNINENKFPASLPNAISIVMETGKIHGLEEIRMILHQCMENSASDLKAGSQLIHKKYDDSLFMKGIKSQFIAQNGPFWGTITGTTPEGLLKIKTTSEELQFGYKEVVYPGW